MKYNIYAGLGGSFGGAKYQFTADFEDYDDAEDAAYQEAMEIYEEYEGLHGLQTWNDVCRKYYSDKDWTSLTEEEIDDIDDIYVEVIEGWIEYYVKPTNEDEISNDDLVMINFD